MKTYKNKELSGSESEDIVKIRTYTPNIRTPRRKIVSSTSESSSESSIITPPKKNISDKKKTKSSSSIVLPKKKEKSSPVSSEKRPKATKIFTPRRSSVVEKSSSISSEVITPKRRITPKKKVNIDREAIVKQLNKIANYYEKSKEEKDKYKVRPFRKGAEVMKTYEGEMEESDLKDEGLGPHTIEEILEINKTGRSKRLEKLIKKYGDDEDEEAAIEELSKIKYIKEKTAKKLYEQGYKTLKDLKKGIKSGKVKLTDAQKLGVKYYDDLKERIPRDEMDKWNKIFTKLLVSDTDVYFKWDLVGSYRRGLPSSSDLDLIITGKNNEDIIKILDKKGYLVAEISNGNHSSIVLVRLNDKSMVRQLDITNFDDPLGYTYGLLHSTGPDNHVILMQERAKDMDYKILNTYGLYDKKNNRLYVNSEKDIFKALKLKYQKPSERVNSIIPVVEED